MKELYAVLDSDEPHLTPDEIALSHEPLPPVALIRHHYYSGRSQYTASDFEFVLKKSLEYWRNRTIRE